jgi:predicted Fe-Mo cluster-binding NifX family protein
MKIAIPLHQGRVSLHFGHSEEFALYEVDPQEKIIRKKKSLSPPQLEPGNWPHWLCKKGADLIIAGAMSMKAIKLFKQYNTEVLLGAPNENAESVIRVYLEGVLNTDNNIYHNKYHHQKSMDA